MKANHKIKYSIKFLDSFALVLFLQIVSVQTASNKYPCTCGRIPDIEQAKHGNFPWTAAIVGRYDMENEPLCWGSLINNFYILSAAHCTSLFESTDIEVILNVRTPNPRRAVVKIKNHPGFNIGQFTYDNDISLLKLREPVDLKGDEIFPICLPPEPPPFYEKSITKLNFSEWSRDCDFPEDPEERTMVISKFTGFEPALPYLVQTHTFGKVNIFTLKNETCSNLYPNRIKAQFICGVVKNNGAANQNAELRSYCQDDPGSALLHLRKMRPGCDPDEGKTEEKIKVRFLQIGISSDQKDCRLHYDKPVLLFTKITRYVSWIKENTYDALYCENSPV